MKVWSRSCILLKVQAFLPCNFSYCLDNLLQTHAETVFMCKLVKYQTIDWKGSLITVNPNKAFI